ncbi:MAG: NAD(P)/FAD-dependent oxidoreductase, partial [Tannerella sp.]|nr:NAD(P)/FAD-dependent oxidoreductase [Tannerella sp.]
MTAKKNQVKDVEKYDVIIIGSGLGGLACGFILAKNGLKVCILEQDVRPGGCLRTFRRGKAVFDTGFHYVGGLDEGQPLNRLFRYFNLLDLPWHRLDEAAFDEVVIGDRPFYFANGYERFTETLAEHFPHQRTNLMNYTAFLKNVGDHLFDSFLPQNKEDIYSTSLFARSAYDFLCKTINDPLLRKILSGTSLKMELNAGKLPLYVFAQINNSFIQSAWRIRGGGSQIAEKLAEQIRAMGGIVRNGARVTRLTETNGLISTVEVNHEERLSGKWVISNAHPAYTLSLVDETRLLRKIYRKRIASLANTFGMFTAHIRLKPESVLYRNRNIYVHQKDADLWHVKAVDTPVSVLVYYPVPDEGDEYVQSIDLLTPMHWSEVERWANTSVGCRGEDYAAMKEAKAAACIEFVSRQIPDLHAGIDKIFTSTPLSYQSYTNTVNGSAYGIMKDYNSPMYTVLTPRTPVPNLLLTGQSLNLHGILGVS